MGPIHRTGIMPIYDQSYKRWDGQYYPLGTRWLIIAGESLRRVFKGKGIKICLFIGAIPFLIWMARIYIAVNFDTLTADGSLFQDFGPIRESLTNIDLDFYHHFYEIELSLVFFVVFIAGGSLIADDRRSNALPVYLSKSITRTDYVLGKAMAVAFPVSLITLVPGILLYFFHAVFRDKWSLLVTDARILFAIVLFSLLVIVSSTLLILAISSLTKQGRYAAFGFIAVVVGGTILSNMLRSALNHTPLESTLGSPKTRLLSLFDSWRRLGFALFDQETSRMTGGAYRWEGFDWPWALLGISIFAIVSLWILNRRIRGMDVIR